VRSVLSSDPRAKDGGVLVNVFHRDGQVLLPLMRPMARLGIPMASASRRGMA